MQLAHVHNTITSTYKCPFWAAVWHRSPDHNLKDQARYRTTDVQLTTFLPAVDIVNHILDGVQLVGPPLGTLWIPRVGSPGSKTSKSLLSEALCVLFGATIRKWYCNDQNQQHAHLFSLQNCVALSWSVSNVWKISSYNPHNLICGLILHVSFSKYSTAEHWHE